MKVGRNDSCPCGSGKKFKKCCIDKPEYNTVAEPTKPNLTLVNPVPSEFETLAESMESGFKALESGGDEKAARIWLEGWHWLLTYIEDKNFTSLRQIDDAIRGKLPEFVGNWVQDLESCLGNLAMRDEEFAKTRLQMVRELTSRLPQTSPEILFNMREAEAETLFLQGHKAEGDDVFAELCNTYPDNAWAYIGWGDMYSPVFFKDRWEKDPVRAREIYESGLNPQVVNDRDAIMERLELLEQET